MRYLIALPVLVLGALYNAWALQALWNTWLRGLYDMPFGVALGVFFVGCWTKSRPVESKKDHEWNALEGMKYELYAPVSLVIVSTILYRLLN